MEKDEFMNDVASKKFERGIIKDRIAEFYDRLDVEIVVTHRSMNHYDATATFVDARMGKVVQHYVVLLKDGHRVEFQ